MKRTKKIVWHNIKSRHTSEGPWPVKSPWNKYVEFKRNYQGESKDFQYFGNMLICGVYITGPK